MNEIGENNDFNQISSVSQSRKRKKRRKWSKKRVYVCSFDNCLKDYGNAAHLKRHEELHLHNGNYKCTEGNCGKEFKTRFTLKKHVDNVHLKKKPKTYKCSYCDEEFNKHCWLTKHEFRHTGILPYLCSYEGCEKRFSFPSRLKRHMKIHKGYACTIEKCDKILKNWTLLCKHMKLPHPLIHKCHYCEKEFSTSSNLKSHLKTHSLECRELFHCPKPDCTRFYTKMSNLNQHLRSFHEKRPYVCVQEHCHRAFKTEAEMKDHFSRHFNKCKRKKKKKSKLKPSFAARLAGLVPQTSLTETHLLQPVIEKKSKDSEKTFQDYTINMNESELSSVQEVEVVSEHNSHDISYLTDDENTTIEEECNVDNGIQTLLNIIEERNKFCNETAVR